MLAILTERCGRLEHICYQDHCTSPQGTYTTVPGYPPTSALNGLLDTPVLSSNAPATTYGGTLQQRTETHAAMQRRVQHWVWWQQQ
jgi:hypothetical protein